MSFRQRSTFVCAAVAAAVILPTAPSAAESPAAAPAHLQGKLNASCEGDVDWTATPGLSFTDQGTKSFNANGTFNCDVPGHPEITGATVNWRIQGTGGCPLGITAEVNNATIRWNNGRTTTFDTRFKLTPVSYTQTGPSTATSGLFKGGSIAWSAENTVLPGLNCVLPGGVTQGKMRKRFVITGGQDGSNLCAIKSADGAQRGLPARRATAPDC